MAEAPVSMNRGEGIRSHKESFMFYLAVCFLGHAMSAAALIAMAGLVLNIPLGELWVPYLEVAPCGLVLAPFLYWSRLVRMRPKSCAGVFTIGIVCYLLVFTLSLGLDAVRLRVLSPAEAFADAPLTWGVLVLVCLAVYGATLSMFQASAQPK